MEHDEGTTSESSSGGSGNPGSTSGSFTPADYGATGEPIGYLGNLKTGDRLPGTEPSNIQKAAAEGRDYFENVNLK